MTMHDLPQRNLSSCVACRLRRAECVCAFAPRLSIATRLIVIVHSKEWRRTTNTGHFVRLAVANAEVRVHGSPKYLVSDEGIDAASGTTLVLYPGRGATPLTPEYVAALERPATLLVPDGNWNQADHMMRRLPMLRNARPVMLDGPNPHLSFLRRNPRAERTSTFEAIAHALGMLEGEDVTAAMLTFLRHVLERVTLNSRRRHAGRHSAK